MKTKKVENAPPLAGWIIACAAGLVIFGVSLLVVGLGWMGSAFVGGLVLLVVGLIFTIAERKPAQPEAKVPAAAPTATAPPEPAAQAAAPAPAAASETAATASPAASETAPAPAAAAPSEASEKPQGLAEPKGDKDDLKKISGVGPVLEGKLNGLGIFHFWQIAKWTPAEIEWVDGFLNFKGRITRDNWVSQAAKLAQDSPSKPV